MTCLAAERPLGVRFFAVVFAVLAAVRAAPEALRRVPPHLAPRLVDTSLAHVPRVHSRTLHGADAVIRPDGAGSREHGFDEVQRSVVPAPISPTHVQRVAVGAGIIRRNHVSRTHCTLARTSSLLRLRVRAALI